MPQTPKLIDCIVLGAGPAGLQLGHHFEEMGLNYQVLEAGDAPGTFFATYPRHRTLISINKVHTGSDDPEVNLRFDWNSVLSSNPDLKFGNYDKKFFPDADSLVEYLADYAREHNVDVRYGVRVARIRKTDDVFDLEDTNGTHYHCKRLIVATGVSKTVTADIPGIELAEDYSTMSTDPDDYLGEKVLIIGKGNSAFETADNLMETTTAIHIAGPSSITLAWRSHFVGHLRAVNNNFLDTYQLKSQNAIIDAEISNIRRTENGKFCVTAKFIRAGEIYKDLEYDRVITCTGFRFDTSIFDESARPSLAIRDRFPDQTATWESTNVEGMFFTGVLTQMRDYKKTTSAFIHGFRYNVRALSRMLAERFHGHKWPTQEISATPETMMKAVVERVNRTSALWQQFGFLGDVLVVRGDRARYYQELPVDYVHSSALGENECYFVVTLEYGADHDKYDPFDVNVERVRQDEVAGANNSQYLHPVLRQYRGGTMVSEHHLVENLENEWCHEPHTGPLEAYFREALGHHFSLETTKFGQNGLGTEKRPRRMV